MKKTPVQILVSKAVVVVCSLLISLVSAEVSSASPPESLSKIYDLATAMSQKAMSRAARSAGIRIEGDVDILLTDGTNLAFAPVRDTQDSDGNGATTAGFLFVSDHPWLPDGYFILTLLQNGQGAGTALLREVRSGKEFGFPLRISPNSDPGNTIQTELSLAGEKDLLVNLTIGTLNYSVILDSSLEIVPTYLPVTQLGESFIATFMTANGIPPESFTITDPLPPGLALNGGSLTGMPAAIGNFEFTVEALDSAGNTGTRRYTLSVLPAGLLILTETLPDGVVNASYGAQLLAIGGIGPLNWRTEGALPDGITFSSTGFFNGRPAETGTFPVTVTVQDQTGAVVSADLALTVNPTGLVNLTPDIFPDGLLGAPYSIPILPDGGTPPYECTLIGGQLPPGLSITGCATTVEGVLRVPGVYGFVIEIKDSSKQPQTLRISRHIVVDEKAPPANNQ